MSYKTILTNLGATAIADAIAAATTVPFAELAVGDANDAPFEPSAAQVALVNEVHRVAVSQIYQHPDFADQVVIEASLASEVGGWTVREVGIFDDEGTLVAVGNFPETYKPLPAEGSTRELIIRATLKVASTTAVSVIVNPGTVIATKLYVDDELAAHAAQPNPHATSADDVAYDNTGSGLVGVDVQVAIDELAEDAEAIGNALSAHAALPNPHGTAAEDVDYDNTASGLVGANVQAALDEAAALGVEGRLLAAQAGWAAGALLRLGKSTEVFSHANPIRSMAALGSLFVAVGDGGLIRSSPDGVAWTVRDPAVVEFNGVGYFDPGTLLWVAVGAAGKIYTSPDGATWTERVSGTAANLHAVAVAPGTDYILAVGAGGVVLKSEDGLAWAAVHSMVGAQSLWSVTQNGPLAVAVGDGGAIAWSFDAGVTWAEGLFGSGSNLYAVARTAWFDAAFWFAVGAGGTILRSADMINWTACTVPVFPTPALRSIHNSEELLIACGDGQSLAVSVDGIAWGYISSAHSGDLNDIIAGPGGSYLLAGGAVTGKIFAADRYIPFSDVYSVIFGAP